MTVFYAEKFCMIRTYTQSLLTWKAEVCLKQILAEQMLRWMQRHSHFRNRFDRMVWHLLDKLHAEDVEVGDNKCMQRQVHIYCIRRILGIKSTRERLQELLPKEACSTMWRKIPPGTWRICLRNARSAFSQQHTLSCQDWLRDSSTNLCSLFQERRC